MNCAYAQSLFGFDLDLLDDSGNGVSGQTQTQVQKIDNVTTETTESVVSQSEVAQLKKKLEISKKGISFLKKKIIDTNTVVEQYYARCDQVAKLEKNILLANNKCQEVCIERDQNRQKWENFEKECEILQSHVQELEKKVIDNENAKAAAESHSHQLQQLVKEQDTTIEGLKLEKVLTRDTNKDLEKRINVLKRHEEHIITQLCTFADIMVTKRALTKTEQIILSRYVKLKKKRDAGEKTKNNNNIKQNGGCETDVSEDFILSDAEDSTEVNNKIFSPPLFLTKQYTNITKSDSKKHDTDDGSSEVISVDGGRGSSLAFSDSDTLYSPEYYLNSPSSQSVENDKHKRKQLDSATSPIPKTPTVDKATSPIIFEIDSAAVQFDRTKSHVAVAVPPKTVDRALSPIRIPQFVVSDIDGIERLSDSEIRCMNLNNSNNSVDNRSDCEVEMILNTMKLSERITPIPSTPASSLRSPYPPTPERSLETELRTGNEYSSELSGPTEINTENNLPEQLVKLFSDVESIKTVVTDIKSKFTDLIKTGTISEETINSSCNINKQQEITLEIETLNDNTLESMVLPIQQTNMSEKNRFNKEREDLCSNVIENYAENDNITEREEDIADKYNINEFKKVSKAKKLSPLDKLRRNLIPKSKIRKHTSPPRRLGSKKASNINTNSKESSSATNNKEIYENGSREMSEKQYQQEKVISPREAVTPKIKKDFSLDEGKRQHNTDPPTRILRSRTSPLFSNNHRNTNDSESSANLNNKEAYEKAVRVMAELKAQQKTSVPKITSREKKISDEDISKQKDNTQKNTTEKKSVTAKQKAVSIDLGNDEEHNLNQHTQVPASDNDDVNQNTNNTTKVQSRDSVISNDESIVARRKSLSPEYESILSRSRKKYPSLSLDKDILVVLTRTPTADKLKPVDTLLENNVEAVQDEPPINNKKCRKRVIDETLDTKNKRILRSAVRSHCYEGSEKNNNESKTHNKNSKHVANHESLLPKDANLSNSPSKLISYNDLDIFNDEPLLKKQKCGDTTDLIRNPADGILCIMINKYADSTKTTNPKKVPESIAKTVSTKIAEHVAHITELPLRDTKDELTKMVKDMQKWTFNEFLEGLMQYLMDPIRRLELYNKSNILAAPSMTKGEQVILFLVTRARWDNVDTVKTILELIEFTLFRLNQTPEMKVVESMAHFYAVLCRYVKLKKRLIYFVFDAMYSMQYSAVALIKQCMEAWMHILPLAHMGLAKNPLIKCLVYLLHFYKCDDKTNKVQDIRNILKQKYFYHVADWDETMILETFSTAILELEDDEIERKMLRLALILLAKRHGPMWCQNKIIKGILMPLIINKNTSERITAFCISMLGSLFKPYPPDMKVHCEIAINQLIDMLDQTSSPVIEEAIYGSLITMTKHNQNRVIQTLLLWQPKQPLSDKMENTLKDFIKEKPLRVWTAILSKAYSSEIH